jgi:hypothetical protein
MGKWRAVAAITFVASTASAQSTDSAAAQALFDEGMRLLGEGHTAEACPKLAESFRLERAPGTEFRLGECYEKIGRIASAWSAFVSVADASKAAGRADREQIARQHASALEPRLTRVVIDVPQAARVPKLIVKRNGVVVGEPQWGTAVPVDPGEQTVEAEAAGKRPWSTKQAANGEGARIVVTIPVLDDAPIAVESPPPPPPPPVAERDRTPAWIAFGVAAVGIGVGSATGLVALSKGSNVTDACHDDPVCPASVRDDYDTSRTMGTVSTISFVVAGVALAAGIALLVWPSHDSSNVGRAHR